jgi:hypothetical protein
MTFKPKRYGHWRTITSVDHSPVLGSVVVACRTSHNTIRINAFFPDDLVYFRADA